MCTSKSFAPWRPAERYAAGVGPARCASKPAVLAQQSTSATASMARSKTSIAILSTHISVGAATPNTPVVSVCVCLATSGPGGIHLLNGLYDATLERVPALTLTGLPYHTLVPHPAT